MIFNGQNQFQDKQVQALRRGDTASLNPAYVNLFKEWQDMNSRYLYMVDDEFYKQSFVDFIQDRVKEMTYRAISQKKMPAKEKTALKQLAARGQVVLASTNKGYDFDELLTLDQIKKVRALDYSILSPTLRSETTNLREVFDEQAAIFAARKLRNSGFEVRSAQVGDDHVIRFEVTPRGEIVSVEIDTAQNTDKPLQYTFISADGGKKNVVETQLPEEYGQAQTDPSLIIPTEEELVLGVAAGALTEEDNVNPLNATNAALAAAAVVNAEKAIKEEQLAELAQLQGQQVQYQVETQVPTEFELPSHNLANVMQSRKELEDRTKTNEQKQTEAKQTEDKKSQTKSQSQITITQNTQTGGGKSFLRKVAVGLGVTGAVTVGGGGLMTIINAVVL